MTSQRENPPREMVRTLRRTCLPSFTPSPSPSARLKSSPGRREDQTQGRGPPPHRAPGSETSVQLRRVPQPQDRIPAVRGAVLLRLRRRERQRAGVPRGDTFFRGGAG